MQDVIEQLQFRIKVLEQAAGMVVLPTPPDPVNEYTGPGYPRIQTLPNDNILVEFNVSQSIVVRGDTFPHWEHEDRPPVYPGTTVTGDKRRFHFAPGFESDFKVSDLDTSEGITDQERIGLYIHRLRNVMVEDNATQIKVRPFVDSHAFYFHPDDIDLPVRDRRAAQGPLTGNPDSGVTPTFSTGAGNTPGYIAGTPGAPYRPWEDKDSEYFGWPVVEP